MYAAAAEDSATTATDGAQSGGNGCSRHAGATAANRPAAAAFSAPSSLERRPPCWLKEAPLSCSLRRAPGGVPEWLKGADCKSVGAAYLGSNPSSPTSVARLAQSAEHLHGKEGVRGSSPRPGSTFLSGPPPGRLSRSAAATPPQAYRARGACRTACAEPHGRGARR